MADAARFGIGGTAGEILDALAEAVTVRDIGGELIYANRKALERMGFETFDELSSRRISSVFDDYLVQDENGRILNMGDLPSVRLLKGEEHPEPLTIRYVGRRTGETRWEILKSSPLFDDAGRTIAAVTIIEDVTSEKLAERRNRFLTEASDTLMSSLDPEETLRNVGWLAVPQIADWCAVDLLDRRGMLQRVVVAHRDPDKLAMAEAIRRYMPAVPNPTQGVGLVLRTGASQLYPEITDETLQAAAADPEHLRLLRELGFRSAVLTPLRARGRTLGVLTLVSSYSLRRFTEEDREFAEQLAARAATAVDNARLAGAQRTIAATLQRNLMPERVPAVPGWEIATLYRAADSSEGVEVGGDFFDFVNTPQGWAVMLGDVTGRGLGAASMTLLVRHGARFVGRAVGSPGTILEQVNGELREQPELSLCTAVCARLGPRSFTYSSAGHPAPLLVRASGAVEELAAAGPILGAYIADWDEVTVPIEPGDTLFVHTDGLTERRGPGGRFGDARLQAVLARCAGATPSGLITELEDALQAFAADEQTDDTAALALRFVG